MVKQRIDSDGVVAQALELVDAEGLDVLGVSRVADELGVKASALYNHVEGVDGLRGAVAARSAANLADALRDAAVGRAGDQAVRAVATAYRSFAAAHPGQFASMLTPSDGSGPDAPSGMILDVLARILETYGLIGDRAVHAARIVRSAIHGFVTLEASQAFRRPQDTDASFEGLVEFVTRGLNAMEAPGSVA